MAHPVRLLVTGFGPFPGFPVNPSERLARAVAASRRFGRLGITVEGRVLETSYDTLAWELPAMLAEARPDVVLMLGVVGRARLPRVEERAVNRASRLSPDASGKAAAWLTLREDQPFALRTGASVVPCVAALRRAGVAARRSIDAGRYLCNAGYFEALARAGPGGPVVLFVHVPRPAGTMPRGRLKHRMASFQAMRFALEALAVVLATAARRAPRPEPLHPAGAAVRR